MRATSRCPALLAFACAALCCSGIALAGDGGYGATDYGTAVQPDADGLSLKAGEFTWLPAAGASSGGPVSVLVNLSAQRAYLYRDGVRIAVTTVSTGRAGHETPTGVFPIMGKERMHHSNKYDNAPMPWMQRLTSWGHALHAGAVRPFPASHGCIRLPAEFARQLYTLTQPGDLVVIAQDTSPRSLAIAFAYAGMDSQLASAIGVTAPLPRIVFVKPGEQAPSVASEGAGGNTTAF